MRWWNPWQIGEAKDVKGTVEDGGDVKGTVADR